MNTFLYFFFIWTSLRRRLDYKSQVSHTIPSGYSKSPSSSCQFPIKTQITMFSSMPGCVKYLAQDRPDRAQTVFSKDVCLFEVSYHTKEQVRRPSAFEVREEAGERNRVAIGDNKVTWNSVLFHLPSSPPLRMASFHFKPGFCIRAISCERDFT